MSCAVLLFQGCRERASVQANLANLLEPNLEEEVERLEAREAGGQQRRRFKALELINMVPETGDPVQLKVSTLPAVMEVTPALIDLPADWYPYATLRMVLAASDACVLRLSAVHVNGPLPLDQELAPDEKTVMSLPLRDLPLASANDAPYEPMGIRVEVLQMGNSNNLVLELKAMELIEAGPDYVRTCVDRYGQRMSTTWPGKVLSDQDLIQDRMEEASRDFEPPAGRSIFGGWSGGPRHTASGFFRVEQTPQGTWWLIDPDGHRFWSAGVTCVNIGSDRTATTGREFLYEALIPAGMKRAIDDEGHVNFFAWNVQRKYDSLEDWRLRTLDRIQSWGFNTIGNWSNPAMMRPGRIPYTRNLGSRSEDTPMASHRLPDVFDPAWEAWFDEQAQKYAGAHRNDPWLIGYFVDNELPWHHPGLLNADANTAIKRAWVQFVQDELEDLEEARSIWGTNIKSWADLGSVTEEDCDKGPKAIHLRKAFEAHYADQYFRMISAILKKHDPNHLYLGCRFVRNAPDAAIVEAAGRYCDAVTVNCYSWEPEEKQFGNWYTMCGRPILIGEHHVTLESPRQVPPPWKVFNAEERERYYKNFVEVWARRPYSLGCHYFQLIDQPLTGRFDGENRTIGWLDITDQPHEDLVRAATATLPNIYEWHDEGN
jgi:hypothetical protein